MGREVSGQAESRRGGTGKILRKHDAHCGRIDFRRLAFAAGFERGMVTDAPATKGRFPGCAAPAAAHNPPQPARAACTNAERARCGPHRRIDTTAAPASASSIFKELDFLKEKESC